MRNRVLSVNMGPLWKVSCEGKGKKSAILQRRWSHLPILHYFRSLDTVVKEIESNGISPGCGEKRVFPIKRWGGAK